jgi:hypothetical protein
LKDLSGFLVEFSPRALQRTLTSAKFSKPLVWKRERQTPSLPDIRRNNTSSEEENSALPPVCRHPTNSSATAHLDLPLVTFRQNRTPYYTLLEAGVLNDAVAFYNLPVLFC